MLRCATIWDLLIAFLSPNIGERNPSPSGEGGVRMGYTTNFPKTKTIHRSLAFFVFLAVNQVFLPLCLHLGIACAASGRTQLSPDTVWPYFFPNTSHKTKNPGNSATTRMPAIAHLAPL
jgi:hypothetical protein